MASIAHRHTVNQIHAGVTPICTWKVTPVGLYRSHHNPSHLREVGLVGCPLVEGDVPVTLETAGGGVDEGVAQHHIPGPVCSGKKVWRGRDEPVALEAACGGVDEGVAKHRIPGYKARKVGWRGRGGGVNCYDAVKDFASMQK